MLVLKCGGVQCPAHLYLAVNGLVVLIVLFFTYADLCICSLITCNVCN